MEAIKYIKKQDSGFKLNPGNSGETSINLSIEIFDLLTSNTVQKGEEVDITFKIYKDDFVKAICFIVAKLPLYKSSSTTSSQIDFSCDLFSSLTNEVNQHFGNESFADDKCTLYYRNDGRIYLKGLKQDSKFSIRDFLVEDFSALKFTKDNNGTITVNVLSNITEAMEEEHKTSYRKELIIHDEGIRNFAFKCISYFSEKPVLWNKINSFIPTNTDTSEGATLTLSKKGSYTLNKIFIFSTETNINTHNDPRRRWFNEPFALAGATAFLSTEWYPSTRENGHAYPLMLPEFGAFIKEWSNGEYEVRKNENTWELWHLVQCDTNEDDMNDTIQEDTENEPAENEENRMEDIPPISFSINTMISLIKETGLLYADNLIKRFAFSLLSKRFLILSGLAGSGKTQLALAFAHALVANKDKQVCVVSVGADWTNREPLLGYPNALQSNQYVRPESGVLDLLIEANKEENQDKPFFLILDEMNMSYVERYFADFLSTMESHEKMVLWNGCEANDADESVDETPLSVGLPKNLFIVGTINVDETTYMFSPKVLDRANVIEFKISPDEMLQFLTEMKEVNRDTINGKAAGMGGDFVRLAADKQLADNKDAKQYLQSFFKELKEVNAEFGYRSATEIFRFISQAMNHDDTEQAMTEEEVLDAAIVQKLLPKLHGSRKKLEPVLNRLWRLCFDQSQRDQTPILYENIAKATFRESADKIFRMYKAANDNGFTSFAEA